MSSSAYRTGHRYIGNSVSGLGRAHYGDNVNHIQTQINNSIGLTINSKAASRTDYNGQYSHGSLLPVKNYVPRPKLHQKIVSQLHDRLEEASGERQLLVVYGIGGAGKSQLVLNYVRTHRQDYAAVFWIEAGQRETIERDFLQIYRLLFDLQPESGQDTVKVEDAVLAVNSWFQRSARRWLMVFDSADAINNEEAELYIDLTYFLPDDPSVHIIVTTRSATAKEMTDLEAVKVAEMEQAEAVELFARYAKVKDALPEIITEIKLILEELGNLALAITLAGSYVAATPRLHSDLKQYLPEYQQRRKELLSQRPKKLVHRYGESVLTTWETTFTAIANQFPIASQLLTLLAFFHFDDIFMGLFGLAKITEYSIKQVDTERSEAKWISLLGSEALVSLYDLETAFGSLESYALVHWKPDQGSYSIHKLVHAWAHDRLDDGDKMEYNIASLGLLTDAMNQCGLQLLDKTRLVPHVMADFGMLSTFYKAKDLQYEGILILLQIASTFLNSLGRWRDVYAIEKFTMDGYAGLHGEEHPDTISAMSNLASTLKEQGQLDEAAKMMKEVLEKRQRILGEEHPDTISAMNNLANTLGKQGQLDEAAKMKKEVLEKMQRILGEEHPSTISAMNNLANTLGEQGQLDEAAKMMKEVLEKRQRILGEEHPDTISAMNNLANTLGEQGQLDEAAKMMKEVLEKRQRILGEEHPDTISAMNNLANTLGKQGQLDEAAKMMKEVLEKMQRILGEEHPSTISAMNNLASTLGEQGQLDEAAKMMKEVLEKMQRILGEEHPSTISAMSNLASTLGEQGQLDEAAKMMKEVLEKRQRILGEEHPSTISAMSNLANTLGDLGQVEEMMNMEKEVLKKRRRILGEEHPDTISAVSNFAITLGDLGQLDEAAKMMKEVFEKRRRIFGDENSATIREAYSLAIFNEKLATIHVNNRELDLAKALLPSALEIFKKLLGVEHASTLGAVFTLAQIYTAQSELSSMIQLTHEWGDEIINLYGRLGRLLLRDSDEVNARIAFQCQVWVLDGVKVFANITCDGCSQPISCAMQCFVCKTCEETDICGACFREREEGTRIIPTCISHSFLEVAPVVLPYITDSIIGKAEKQLWFQGMWMKYVECVD